MNIQTISTKQLRQELPQVRDQLAKGVEFILIHRSKPIASLTPLSKKLSIKLKDISSIAGGHRFQETLGKVLTPDYLNSIAEKRYE